MNRRHSEIHFDMFPFLSVLCAVIGILMLFLLGIISSGVLWATESSAYGLLPVTAGPPPSSAKAGLSEEQHDALRQQIIALRQRLADRHARLRELKIARRQLLDVISAKNDLLELGAVAKEGRREGTRLARRAPST